ncbi:hypothetical protein ACF1AU_05595 [Streptomyces rubrogriseus]|uniref:hypothetical protein n=1 Tax=Streptomyces rubrogriseus TaxID=194673 RepID=UPI0037022A22
MRVFTRFTCPSTTPELHGRVSPAVPRQGESGSNGVEVLAEETGEALHRYRRILFSLPDPFHQEVSALVADQVGERPGEVAGTGNVRAGEPDLKESLVLAVSERLGGAHAPRGDLARAGDVGPDRFGGARAEGGEVFADDLAAAAVAPGLDLQEQSGAADLALCLGEAGVEVCLEGFQDSIGAAFAGGGQQLVEVGVAEAAHGLAVEVESAGDGPDGPAFHQELVDVFVAVAGPFDDLGAGQPQIETRQHLLPLPLPPDAPAAGE